METKTDLAGYPLEHIRAHMDRTRHGPVVIVQAERMVSPSTERYAVVRVCFHGRVAVSWCSGDEHTFDARTGLCIESSDGRMNGWRIAPHEMHRFNAVDAAKWLEAQKAGEMSVGTARSTDRLRAAMDELRDVQRRFPLGEKLEIEIIRADDGETKTMETQQDIQPVRSVLFIATCYPGGSFAIDAIDTVYKAMHALALEHGLVTMRDQCEYVTMEGALVGQRFDVIISTDDWLMNILRRECAETHWWNSQVLPRKRVGSSLHFLSTVLVKRRPVPTEPTASPTPQQ